MRSQSDIGTRLKRWRKDVKGVSPRSRLAVSLRQHDRNLKNTKTKARLSLENIEPPKPLPL